MFENEPEEQRRNDVPAWKEHRFFILGIILWIISSIVHKPGDDFYLLFVFSCALCLTISGIFELPHSRYFPLKLVGYAVWIWMFIYGMFFSPYLSWKRWF